jgi:predicted dehydrogenase
MAGGPPTEPRISRAAPLAGSSHGRSRGNIVTTLTESHLDAKESRSGSPTPLKPVRLAVAGLGRAGIVHAAVSQAIPNVEVVGFSEPNGAVREAARGAGFQLPTFDKLAALLRRQKPDALIVTGAHYARPALVREALDAGVAVLADRPLSPALHEAESLVLLARERQVTLASSHALVFHPVFAEASAILASGALGAPRRVRCSTYRSRVFDSSRQAALAAGGTTGGVLLHEAVDALFYAIETFGLPRQVHATAQRLFGVLEDEVHVMLTLPTGGDIGLDASWSVPGYPAAATVLEFEGENGKLLASDDAIELDVVEDRGPFRAGHTRLGLADLTQHARFDLDGEVTYRIDAAFLAWVAGGEPPVHRAERAVRALRVMDALYASSRNGGAIVPLAVS